MGVLCLKLYIGVDLGTSAVKLLLMDETGQIKNIVTKEYPLEFPQPGWSQQNPEDWKKAVEEGIPELLTGFNADDLAGIGCGEKKPSEKVQIGQKMPSYLL